MNNTRPPDAALPPSGGGHAQAQSPSVPLISSVPSGLGPASGSGGSGGVDVTDQGTARNTYSMQVHVLHVRVRVLDTRLHMCRVVGML